MDPITSSNVIIKYILYITAATQSQTAGGMSLKDRIKKAPSGAGNM